MPAAEETSDNPPHSAGSNREQHSTHASAPGTAPSSGLRGSRQVLGSRSNLLASRHGSRTNLTRGTMQEEQVPPVNAVVFENTYKTKPDRKFQSGQVRRLTEEILQKSLTKVKYDSEQVPVLCQTISNEILAAVKKLDYERYKFVVDVTIGEFKGQGIRVASRALWDTTTDSYASVSFKNATLFAVAIVFGCYYE
ncbi:uncharacterized protein SPPG_03639 [Spizellomyces punctatus DAOM BR117]|uniref:Tctex-1 family protein n=1 Tax=Spizellomyces punctatus (strain DAOM BR117) TaxID=645134 RepID=A0A0L0HM01_SPIPD|nr:uncharacterized protein SPPG_03639 [Spizellomyces punctatus DAOM BR117]KND01849.1 hypothetical protein SPPG_03639 [Spizellomyces punctatus DAOM BR117]|eukprot:XP_016609888.1 hypothetical protein SPPG_03639 [Spizellomyces punctatus DAOM BR117]